MGCNKANNNNTNKPTTVPAKPTGPVVKTIKGVTYFKLRSDYEGDYTKNCGLLGNEIDENFYFLRSNDIKTGWTEEIENKKFLILQKMDDEIIKIDITDAEDTPYEFWEQDGHIWIKFPNGEVRDLRDNEGNPVTFLIEGYNVHITTDASINGDGSFKNPVSLDLAYRTGTYMPADFFVDLSCPEANITMVSGVVNGHAIVTKESLGRFGALYTFDEAEKIDAALAKEGRGWRLPTKEDWAKMLNWAEGEDCVDCQTHDTDRSGNFGCIAGARLKSKEYWKRRPGDDDFGFTIFPVGICPEIANTAAPSEYGFEGLYEVSTFWSSSKSATDEIYVRTFSYGHNDVAQYTEPRKKRFSIRLVRDINDDFDIPQYDLILGDYLPVIPTTDGKQLWTSINIGVVGYEDYDPRGVTVPEAWKDVTTNIPAEAYYEMLYTSTGDGKVHYGLIDEAFIPSSEVPANADRWDIEVDEGDSEPYKEFGVDTSFFPDEAPKYAKRSYIIHMDMATETKFFYNAWDGNRWHKKLMREGESVVLLYEDYQLEQPCDTAATPYVTEDNKNHEWRVFVNPQTGLDELIDTAEALKDEFKKELKEIREAISALTEDVTNLSGFVGDMHDEMVSGFTSAFTAIDDLQKALDEEISARTEGDEALWEALGEEVSARTEADEELWDALNEEISARTAADEELWDALSAETADRIAADEYLQEQIDELKEREIQPKDNSIEVEIVGNTTFINVRIDEEDKHLKVGDEGMYFDGDFGLI